MLFPTHIYFVSSSNSGVVISSQISQGPIDLTDSASQVTLKFKVSIILHFMCKEKIKMPCICTVGEYCKVTVCLLEIQS